MLAHIMPTHTTSLGLENPSFSNGEGLGGCVDALVKDTEVNGVMLPQFPVSHKHFLKHPLTRARAHALLHTNTIIPHALSAQASSLPPF